MTADAVGGVWTYAMELTAELARRDVHTTLAVMGPAPSVAQAARAHDIPGLELVHIDAKLEWMHDPWDDVERAGAALLALAARAGADLVHLNGYAHATLPWRKPVLVTAHSCVCSWWEAVHGAPPPPEWDRYRERVTNGLNAADRIVAPTQAYLQVLRRLYAPSAPASVVHNARSAAPFAHPPGGRRDAAIAACGRLWDEAKNLRVLDAAARELEWPVRVAGPARAPDGESFAGAALEPLGTLTTDALADALQHASIFAHPAKYEPFGLSVLEAALAGCTLVLSDLPTLRELWDDAAWFTPAEDSDAWRWTLRALIAAPQRRRALAMKAQARAQRFAPERMGIEYLSLYAALLARGRGPEHAVA